MAKGAKALANAGDAVTAGIKSADDLAASAFKASYKFDPSSIGRGMKSNSYFKNIKLPDIPLKTSSLFHTPDALKSLKKVDASDLVSKSTSDLLSSVSKSVDDLPLKSVDDLATSLKKVDIDDLSGLAIAAKQSSLGKLKDISTQLSKTAKKKADVAGDFDFGIAKGIDEAADATNGKAFKKTGDMTDAMKSSKKTSKYMDDVADASAKAGKKNGLDVVDDVAKSAKNNKFMDALKFASKNDGKLQMGIVGTFLLAEQISGKDYGDVAPGELARDPGDADVSTAIAEASVSAEVTTIDEGLADKNSMLNSDATLLGVAAIGVASMVL